MLKRRNNRKIVIRYGQTELDCRRVIVDVLKQTRGGTTWKGPDDEGNRFNWSEELPLGEWDGIAPGFIVKRIQVDGNGMITILFLSYLGMRGLLPECIGSLTSLTHLDVSHNQLARLPESIRNLASLTNLCVNNNLLVRIPDSVSNLASLTWLDIRDNPITSNLTLQNEVIKRFERIGLFLFVN